MTTVYQYIIVVKSNDAAIASFDRSAHEELPLPSTNIKQLIAYNNRMHNCTCLQIWQHCKYNYGITSRSV